jgi:penicillin-binding protein 1A
MGIDNALQHIARFGFDPDTLPHNLSLALGSADVTPLQMAMGYAVLANGGYRVEPHWIERIEQTDQGVVYEASPALACDACAEAPRPTEGALPQPAPVYAPRVLDERNRYLMYSMLQDVIRAGTATKAKTLGRTDLAGKTGTTNDQRDAWFNGFNQRLVANTWVGFDDNGQLGRGEVGGRAALPAWIDFMREALAGVPDEAPQMPDDMVTLRIDPVTGQPATAATEGALFEMFRAENAPGVDAQASDGDGPALVTPVVSPPPTQDLF